MNAQELRFGFSPIPDEDAMWFDPELLSVRLSSALGQAIGVFVARDEHDLRKEMEASAVDIARLSPLAYVEGARGGRMRVIAQSVRAGSTTSRGLIIKRFDSGINRLTDLETKRFAFVDPRSALGYVYGRAMLIEGGIDPERSFRETMFGGSHEKVIAAVLLGMADAGSTHDGAVEAAKSKGLPTFDLEVLAQTDALPQDAIAVRVGLGDTLVKRIQAALVNMDRTPAGGRKLSGFVPADDSRFDAVRRAVKKGGM
jgi:phosphonate transport system substrate-binding protein